MGIIIIFVLYHSFCDVFRNNVIGNNINISWNLFRRVSLILLSILWSEVTTTFPSLAYLPLDSLVFSTTIIIIINNNNNKIRHHISVRSPYPNHFCHKLLHLLPPDSFVFSNNRLPVIFSSLFGPCIYLIIY